MGVWGAGNLESDGTLDVLGERSDALTARLWATLQNPESWEADEGLHDALFVDIEWAIALHKAGLLNLWSLAPVADFDAAVATWVQGWSAYFDGLAGEGFKAERLQVIQDTFATLRGLYSTAHRQRGGDLQAGDVVSMPAPGGALFARVLQVLGPDCGLPPQASALSFGPALLLELWAQAPSEAPMPAQCPVLISGVVCDLEALEEERWTVVGHKPVRPEEVDYPMCISNEHRAPKLSWGAIHAPIDLPFKAVEAIGVFPTLLSSETLPERTLLAMGLEELLAEEDLDWLAMDSVDLRFSEDRGGLMVLAGLDPTHSYPQALAAFQAKG